MERSLTTSKELHFDLITNNILHKLPAKSLLRFTSTCKTWYHLIKSPQFITTHLNVKQTDAKDHHILILGEQLCYVLADRTIIQHIKLGFYIDYAGSGHWNTPIGSCNGLVLVPIRSSFDRKYLLWNPSINKFNELESKVHTTYYDKCDWVTFNHEVFGLGYDESSNDHRVVRICDVIDDRTGGKGHIPTKIDVYSLCTDSWHRVYSNPGQLIGSSRGVFVNGIIHWLATTRFTMVTSTPDDDHFESILLFDVENESFEQMVLPEDLHCIFSKMMVFDSFKGSLAVIIFEITPTCSMFVLWVMTDYGVIESWTKKFTIINGESYLSQWPVGILSSGILVYSENEYKKTIVVFFDVDNGQTWNIEWLMDCSEVMDFMDSLILFQG